MTQYLAGPVATTYDEETGELVLTYLDAYPPGDPDPASFISTHTHEVRIPTSGIVTSEEG